MSDPFRWILSITFSLAAFVGLCIGLPLWAGWVGPNAAFGVRTAQTLADPKLWYSANAALGKHVLIFNGLFLLAILVSHYTVSRTRPLTAGISLTALLIAGYLTSFWLS